MALLVVGPAKLPEVARSLGKALGEFRRLADDVKETIEPLCEALSTLPAFGGALQAKGTVVAGELRAIQ